MGFQKKPVEAKTSAPIVEAPKNNTEAFKALEQLSKELDKKHGTTGSLQRLGKKKIIPVAVIPTDLATFDYGAIECGGIPKGAIVEIFGGESTGKTSFSLHVVAQEQNNEGRAAFIDAEHALDLTYARTLGVNVDDLIFNQPDSGEQALDIVQQLILSKCVSIIVVDSVAALVPESELAGEMGDASVGVQARLMSQAMRKLTGIARKNNVTVIFLNQLREKIGVIYGNPNVTTGGRALKFYSSVRIEVKRRDKIMGEGKDNIVGHQIELQCVKNKVGRPFRKATVDLIYPGTDRPAGFDTIGSLVEYASRRGLFETKGSHYYYNGTEIANGLAKLKEALRTDTKVLSELKKKIATLEKEDGVIQDIPTEDI